MDYDRDVKLNIDEGMEWKLGACVCVYSLSRYRPPGVYAWRLLLTQIRRFGWYTNTVEFIWRRVLVHPTKQISREWNNLCRWIFIDSDDEYTSSIWLREEEVDSTIRGHLSWHNSSSLCERSRTIWIICSIRQSQLISKSDDLMHLRVHWIQVERVEITSLNDWPFLFGQKYWPLPFRRRQQKGASLSQSWLLHLPQLYTMRKTY